MACFLVAAAAGLITTACSSRIPEKYHIGWLNAMIWVTVAALAVEHVWHGEIVPWFPFLTAMNSAGDTAAMLYEMGTIGVGMLVGIVAIWAVMVYVYNHYITAPAKNTASA